VKAVVFHPDAEAELHAAVAWYEEQREGLGADLLAEVEKAIDRLQENPHLFPRHNELGIRKCLVRRFPYTIFYLELDEADWVAAVAHQRRRPGYWVRRSP
jgi:toxin ParE1/3/4